MRRPSYSYQMDRVRNSTATTAARRYILDIYLTPAQLEACYAGSVDQVSALDRTGRRLQFPLASLRPHVTHAGVRGTFELGADAQHRLLYLRRC